MAKREARKRYIMVLENQRDDLEQKIDEINVEIEDIDEQLRNLVGDDDYTDHLSEKSALYDDSGAYAG
jgi:hypothetical protein